MSLLTLCSRRTAASYEALLLPLMIVLDLALIDGIASAGCSFSRLPPAPSIVRSSNHRPVCFLPGCLPRSSPRGKIRTRSEWVGPVPRAIFASLPLVLCGLDSLTDRGQSILAPARPLPGPVSMPLQKLVVLQARVVKRTRSRPGPSLPRDDPGGDTHWPETRAGGNRSVRGKPSRPSRPTRGPCRPVRSACRSRQSAMKA